MIFSYCSSGDCPETNRWYWSNKHQGSNWETYDLSNNGPTWGGGHDLAFYSGLNSGYTNIEHTYTFYNLYNGYNQLAGSYSGWTALQFETYFIDGLNSKLPPPIVLGADSLVPSEHYLGQLSTMLVGLAPSVTFLSPYFLPFFLFAPFFEQCSWRFGVLGARCLHSTIHPLFIPVLTESIGVYSCSC